MVQIAFDKIKEEEKKSLIGLKSHYSVYGKHDFYIETVLRYKTPDGYRGSIVKIRSKRTDDIKKT